jgi:hypothetical protein
LQYFKIGKHRIAILGIGKNAKDWNCNTEFLFPQNTLQFQLIAPNPWQQQHHD